MRKKVLAAILLALFTSACAKQQALFISEPAGASVFINGEKIGTTPCTYNYSLSAGQRLQVSLEKSGYEEIHYRIKTDEVDARERAKWLAAGVVWSPLWLGTLFTKKLKDSYEIVMQEETTTLTAGGSAQSDSL
ncbi:PEGA domain-containing protein [Geoalkalibacter halelectricus]|uniref:PEGA domain-containing protein n=1 Tax=Geoalkalibacter halelectricus TaxID=2847045 RepID=A0ABY5ZM36_9BACT|nr:PEGA domain-containing protein [Geoalkalibacter halelectricus]MDO3378448.1 PEGA domain-containing protein [Geoalkalibacter halelectricus]UWZ80232.1 PEGA domain-containing protein [Geoalkalibacter halelectricus]